MEMGAGKAFRDLHDTHNGGNGLDNSTVNQMVGANAIWYSAGAVNPNNLSGAAMIAYDPTDVSDRPYYCYAPSLAGRFLIYRCYWDHTSMRFTVVDNGIVSNPTGDPDITYVGTTNTPLMNQMVGASSPLLGTNTLPTGTNTMWPANGLITLGMTNQWHFYVVTNPVSNPPDFTNAAFIR